MISTIEWFSVKDSFPLRALLVVIDEGAIAYSYDGYWFYGNGDPVDSEVKYWAEIPEVSSPQLSTECPRCGVLLGEIKQLRGRLKVAEKDSLEQQLAVVNEMAARIKRLRERLEAAGQNSLEQMLAMQIKFDEELAGSPWEVVWAKLGEELE